MIELTEVDGIGPAAARALNSIGITSAEKLTRTSPDRLVKFQGITRSSAVALIATAREFVRYRKAENNLMMKSGKGGKIGAFQETECDLAQRGLSWIKGPSLHRNRPRLT